jgi:nucleotide-binding universal stress UspA family protein
VSTFDRVVCGVDHSEAGVAAARVAGLLAAPAGQLTLVSVNNPSVAVHAGWAMKPVLAELAAEARSALERGRDEAEAMHALQTRLVDGDPLHILLAEVVRRDATAVVVGSHGISRATGIALGAVSTYLLHEAPCSVVIARGTIERDRWPRRIAVGVDGSDDASLAMEAARELSSRFGSVVRAVVATKDSHVDVEAARRIAPECEQHEAGALEVLNVQSETSDLVIVGSRGLRGLRALGSLSERLAHEARCSVLVVRKTDPSSGRDANTNGGDHART